MPPPDEPAVAALTGQRRILLITFGSRGDVQPLCVLGRALTQRGYAVRIIANSDNARTVAAFGLDFVDVGLSFSALLRDPAFEKAFLERYRRPHALVGASLGLYRTLKGSVLGTLHTCLAEIDAADLVVYTFISTFAGALAAERSIPSVQLSLQPNFPTSRISAVNLSGRDFGGPLNRASYELWRLYSALTWPIFRAFRKRTGRGRLLKPWTLPVALSLRLSDQILAYSEALAGSSEGAPPQATRAGFFFHEPEPGTALPQAVAAFLREGPKPVFVGFGSMLHGAKRNTRVVMEALAAWGGRAIVSTGTGLARPAETSPNVLILGTIDYALLFPHVAAAVHHGGAGTAALALRYGLPSVILPGATDQLFWGRRVAALGAGEAPIPIDKVTSATLAQRIRTATTDQAMRAAAERLGAQLRAEPGLPVAVAQIEAIFSARAFGRID